MSREVKVDRPSFNKGVEDVIRMRPVVDAFKAVAQSMTAPKRSKDVTIVKSSK